jgi:hypothetical protein
MVEIAKRTRKEKTMSKTTPALTLNHLALSVKDLDTSIGFYKELFNLREITNRTKIEGIR